MTHPRLRQLAALATTLALLAGLPWLATLLTWPVLDLSWTSVQVHLRSARLPQGAGAALLILALWGLWSLYLAVVITEAIGRFRHRPPRLRLLRPLQMLAATTLGTIAVYPAAAHAAAPATTVSEAPAEPVAEDLTETETDQRDVEEPVLIDRSRTIDSFGYDSAELNELMRQDVQAIAQLIDQHGSEEIPVVVTGHTDAAGDAAYNLDLSQRRAEAVAEQLRTHLGEGITVRAEGEGDRALLDSADDAEQRRVEISYSVLLTPPPPSDTPPAHHGQENGDAPEETFTPAVGLSLPGGLILAMTTGTAGVVAGMALERRRGQPQHSSGADEASTDAHNQAEAAHHTAEAPLPPGAPVDTDEDAEDERPELAMIDLARVPGLGVTGPGAEGAARTLLTRALEHSESALTVVVPSNDLHALLDETRRLPQLDEDASIMVTDGVEDALTLLQLQVLARHRAADEHNDAEDQDTAPPSGPQFVLLARADAGVATEVTSLLAHTPNAPLHAILLGPWPQDDGPTMSIDAHGVITTAGAPFAEAVGHRWATTASSELYRALLTRHDTPLENIEDTEDADAADDTDTEGPEPEPEPGAEAATSHQAEVSAGAVSVTVLGRITLAVHGHQVRPHRRAAYEVLSYLAAHPAGVRLEAAVEAMWPQDTGHRAIRRWHDACTSVRTACRPLLGEDATTVIIHDGDLYRLNPDLVVCDLWRVEQFLDEADHSGAPTELASSAAAMCDGDFASESDYLWAHGPRTRLRTRLVTALVRTAQNEEPVQAQSLLHRAVEIDPSDIDAAHDLIKLCLDRGEERTARRIYHRHKLAVEDLGGQLDGTITQLLGGVEIS